MSVNNGQKANESNFNAAFISKTDVTGNDVSGIINLKNSSATESGDEVLNLQKELNMSRLKLYATETITTDAQVSIDNQIGNQFRTLVSNSGALDISLTPFGSSATWRDGTIVYLMGTNNTNYPTLKDNDSDYGAILNGDIALKRFVMIKLIWLNSLLRWIEVGSNIR